MCVLGGGALRHISICLRGYVTVHSWSELEEEEEEEEEIL